MDRNQLEVSLQPFTKACLIKGRPLIDMCVYEAYPGDVSTSYIIQVKADWVQQLDCSEAIDFLFDTLWETVNEDTRKYIFSIEYWILTISFIAIMKPCLKWKKKLIEFKILLLNTTGKSNHTSIKKRFSFCVFLICFYI